MAAERVRQEVPRPGAGGYPPSVHVLRDLRLWTEFDGERVRAGLPVVPEILDEWGRVPAGVLAVLVDLAGGWCAIRAALPRRIATSDLVIHLTRTAASGSVFAHPELLRTTRSTAVIEVSLADDDGGEVGLATMTFAIFDGRGPGLGLSAQEPARSDFAGPDSGFSVPLLERLDLRRVDPSNGVLELPLEPYVVNSLGSLQGGITGVLVDRAAAEAARAHLSEPHGVTDLALNYLALARGGPIRTRARLLREGPVPLARVEVHDVASGRLMTVATAALAPADPIGSLSRE